MSDYTKGKNRVIAWTLHWEAVARHSDAGDSTIAGMVDYHTSVRAAFVTPHIPDVMILAMPDYIRSAHYCIMALEPDQREAVIVWNFGDDDERLKLFGSILREPKALTSIYRRIGRLDIDKAPNWQSSVKNSTECRIMGV